MKPKIPFLEFKTFPYLGIFPYYPVLWKGQVPQSFYTFCPCNSNLIPLLNRECWHFSFPPTLYLTMKVQFIIFLPDIFCSLQKKIRILKWAPIDCTIQCRRQKPDVAIGQLKCLVQTKLYIIEMSKCTPKFKDLATEKECKIQRCFILTTCWNVNVLEIL